jgi:signal peptidase II
MIGKNKKIYLVNRDFQLRYTKVAIGVAVISTLLSAVVILYPLYVFEILRIPKFLPLPILGAMLFSVLLNIALIGFLGVLITHRLAGPIYALTREFRKIGGRLWGSTLKIRSDDDLKYLVRCFNEMSEELVKVAESDLETLVQIENELKNAGDPAAQAIGKLQSLQKSIKDRILTQTDSNETE